MRNILKNPLYDGRPVWGKTKGKVKKVNGEKVQGRVARPADDWQYGTAPRIVEHELWERVQRLSAEKRAKYVREPIKDREGNVIGTTGKLQATPTRRSILRMLRLGRIKVNTTTGDFDGPADFSGILGLHSRHGGGGRRGPLR